ncbi:MAG: histidine kinase [Beijerinckiaceae bacterium]|nr:histidine kinase [Beijerinckiaceae bacterium]
MPLRIRLICLVAMVLAASLGVEVTIVSFNASRSVQTEMSSALEVGEQIVKSALTRLPSSADPRRDLEELVAAFKGNRHLRVTLTSSGAAAVEPSVQGSRFGAVPPWFGELIGLAPLSARLPVVIAGRDFGGIVIETDPRNEVLEVWNSLGDSLLTLILFFSLSVLLIYYFIGRALRPLGRLAAALEQVGYGNYAMRLAGKPVAEVSRLQTSFNRMSSELAAMDEDKRRLNERLLTLQEEERSEIARDLHDEVSPCLFAVNADLAAIARLADQGRGGEIAGQIRSTMDAVSHMQRQIRTLLLRLRSGVLDDFGLSAAIMSMVEFWHWRRPETRFHLRLPPDGTSFGPLLDNAVYRIVQEGLSNAIRHGDPAEITVTVKQSTSSVTGPDWVTVEVSNDGAGMDKSAGFGFGLTGMQERVYALGGRLLLARDPGVGLTVTATLPIPARSTGAHANSLDGST